MEIIHIKSKSDLRYGWTDKPFEQTFGEIMALLQKHNCDRVATMRDGEKHIIGFEYQEIPYIVNIPRVFVKGKYNEKIGVRLVKYYLEIILDWAKLRVIDFEFIMLGTRMVKIDEQAMTLKEAVDNLPPITLMEGLSKRTILLEGDKDGAQS